MRTISIPVKAVLLNSVRLARSAPWFQFSYIVRYIDFELAFIYSKSIRYPSACPVTVRAKWLRLGRVILSKWDESGPPLLG